MGAAFFLAVRRIPWAWAAAIRGGCIGLTLAWREHGEGVCGTRAGVHPSCPPALHPAWHIRIAEPAAALQVLQLSFLSSSNDFSNPTSKELRKKKLLQSHPRLLPPLLGSQATVEPLMCMKLQFQNE